MRLRREGGLTQREIPGGCGMAQSTVHQVLARALPFTHKSCRDAVAYRNRCPVHPEQSLVGLCGSGKRGQGSENKTPLVAAVEVTGDTEQLVVLRLSLVTGFRKAQLERWAREHLEPGTTVRSDGLACFQGVEDAGCQHEPTVTGGGPGSCETPGLTWVNTLMGNIKRSIDGSAEDRTCRGTPRGAARFSLAGWPLAHPGSDLRTATLLRPLRGIASTVSVPVLRHSDSTGLHRLP